MSLVAVPPFLMLGVTLTVGGLLGARRLHLGALRPGDVLLGIYGLFVYHLCLFLALRWAPPVEANLLNYLWPLLIVLLSPFFIPGVRLGPRAVFAAALAFAGAVLLVTGGRWSFHGASAPGYGLAIAAAVVWATYSLASKRRGGFPTSTISAFCLVDGALALICHAMFEVPHAPSGKEWALLAIAGLGPMGAAFYLWDRAMSRGDPRTIGTLAYLTPLASTLLLALTAGRPLTPTAGLAMVLIVGGAVLGTTGGRPPPRSPPSGAEAHHREHEVPP
ncbi:DMT family transporter [Myxococcota bacterium]|nr:DMT family transporter [Myxococcota bacterium]